MRNKPRRIASIIVVASLFVVFIMILLLNRLVNVTLYNYGLQFSVDWGYQYVIYLYVGTGLLLVSIILVGLGFVNVAYPAEKDEEQGGNSLLGRREESVSVTEVIPLSQAKEEKTEIKPQSSNYVSVKKETSPVHCRSCGFENEPGAVFCEDCGKSMVARAREFLPSFKPASSAHLFCGACGTKNRVSAVYCKKCGRPLNQ